MRVLIPTGAFPPEIGGPATYVPCIATALVERGHAVEVVTLSSASYDQRYADDRYPFRIYRLPKTGGRAWRWASVLSHLTRRLRKSDMVFVNGLLLETVLANLGTRRPMVAKVVGDMVWERARDKAWTAVAFEAFQQGRYGWRIEWRRALRNWALGRMVAVIAPSVYLQTIVQKWGVDSHCVHVIYNACDPISPDIPPLQLPLSSRYHLITVCRLIREKGVDKLIEVVATLPEVGLVVVGDGPERPKLESLAYRLGIGARVHFAGNVSKEQVFAYLQACDLFVLNSCHEGLPHVLLEALAVGLPVVATAVGGTPEVVQNGVNQRLVAVGDAKALRQAIHDCLEKAGQIHRFTPEKFTLQRMLSKTTALLEGIGNARPHDRHGQGTSA